MIVLDRQLEQLENAQLLRRLAEEELAYQFKHGLTLDVAYASLLKSDRRRLHRAVAQAIEQVFQNRVQDLSDVLAYHWEQAEVPDRARRYLFQAGEAAARRYANSEALNSFTRALAIGQDAAPEELMRIREARAQIHEFRSRYAEALADYQAVLALARQSGRAADECRLLTRMAWVLWLSGNGEEALRLAEQVETQARALDDRSDFLRAYLVAGTLEPFFLKNATRWAVALREAGADVVMTERVGSHGDAFWREEFPLMVAWAFGH